MPSEFEYMVWKIKKIKRKKKKKKKNHTGQKVLQKGYTRLGCSQTELDSPVDIFEET